jgi:hypothetical protein
MNNESPKFRHTHKQESQHQHEEQHVSQGKEFSSVEELLRHDADQVAVPAGLAVKLNESIANSPKPEQPSWWRRIFGK